MSAPTKVTLTGGKFQDSEGNALSGGYLLLYLSQDAQILGVGNIASGIAIKVSLDVNGSAVASQMVWGNDQMLPPNSYYRVIGYTAAGQPAWGPNNQQIIGNGGTFDLGTWIPNAVFSWTPPPQPLQLQTDGTSNPNQGVLNFKDTATVTWATDANGDQQATASTPPGIDLQVNSVDNASQTKLNFEDTGSVTWVSSAGGVVKATASPTAPTALQLLSGGTYIAEATGSGFVGLGVALQNDGLNSNEQAGAAVGEGATSLFLTSASSGIECQTGESNGALTLGSVAATQARVALSQTTTIRAWIGMSVNYQSTLQADIPACALAMFRYSTHAGDSTWKAITQTASGAAQTVTDTGVAVDTNFHTFAIVPTAAGIQKFYIDGILVASISTTLPLPNQPMHYTVLVDNITFATAEGFYISYFAWKNNH